jgi:copper chaperone CopZ
MKRVSIICVVVTAMFGCSKHSDKMPAATAKAVEATAFNVAKLPTVAFSVPEMMCPDGCGVKVKEILSEQPGAKEVVVDFDNKTATVAIEDGAQFDSNAALAALEDHQFKNSAVKNGEVAAPAADVSDPAPPASTEKAKDGSAG